MVGHTGKLDAAIKAVEAIDIAPTLLDLLGLPQPAEMSGRSLLLPA